MQAAFTNFRSAWCQIFVSPSGARVIKLDLGRGGVAFAWAHGTAEQWCTSVSIAARLRADFVFVGFWVFLWDGFDVD